MTNEDRLLSLLGFQPPINSTEGEFIDAEIVSSDTYVSTNSVPIKKMAIKILEILLSTADTTNEQWNKIVFDREAVLKRINNLKDEVGLSDGRPTITGKCVW